MFWRFGYFGGRTAFLWCGVLAMYLDFEFGDGIALVAKARDVEYRIEKAGGRFIATANGEPLAEGSIITCATDCESHAYDLLKPVELKIQEVLADCDIVVDGGSHDAGCVTHHFRTLDDLRSYVKTQAEKHTVYVRLILHCEYYRDAPYRLVSCCMTKEGC